MDSFSYTDSIRAAFSSCLPCFAAKSTLNTTEPQRPRRTNPHSPELEGLLQDAGDTDTEAETLSLHSNIGSSSRRARKRPAFSVTLFGIHLFGRPPIYLSDDEDGDGDGSGAGRRHRQHGTTSSSTLDSDAAPLDASTIARLSSPEPNVQEALRREEEERQRKAERRARRRERRERERQSATMMHFPAEGDDFEGFQGSGAPLSLSAAVPEYGQFVRGSVGGYDVGGAGSGSGDADDADLGGELYTRKRPSGVGSASGSDSRSRTSTSMSNGDQSVQYNHHVISQTQAHASSYTRNEMPALPKKKKGKPSKRSHMSSSTTSQSTTPYTPTDSAVASPAVAAFPIPHEAAPPNIFKTGFSGYPAESGESRGFPSAGLSGARSKSRDMGAFLARRDD
ncbi:hypothetical protein BJ138DRAFT_302779 [Hygrophoropsis aurantiaca]|uniref:Uncharacterized protein n=1 Tax=Hygrophoropsis aurantiaca TaxID=72124 RepID=A0ACB8A688_9AGAM|nr:hypothetical protein BJ138DRAFT_302779 [Hygrophoropsis aurantiaca]